MDTNLFSYNALVAKVKDRGMITSPRGMTTSEILNERVSFVAGTFIHRQGSNLKLAFLEACMLVGGIFELDLIREVAPNANIKLFEKQSDYGARVRNQIPLVIEELTADPFSRRAVIQFNGGLHLGGDNIACTLNAQFLKREPCFFSLYTMRSWDLTFGFPNDIVMFGMLSAAVARCIHHNSHWNEVSVTAGSLHLYESTQHLAYSAADPMKFVLGPEWPSDWKELRKYAADLARDHKSWVDYHPKSVSIVKGNSFWS